MSYPMDLDEYTDAELETELRSRANLNRRGRCSYCGQLRSEPTCRFPDRHNGPHIQENNRDLDKTSAGYELH